MAMADGHTEMEGVESTNVRPEAPLMTEQEKRILDIYDRLEELQLEIALLGAQNGISQNDLTDEVSEEDIKSAQRDLLKAKALYQVRNNVLESVLVANPILKAVHAGGNATVAEQDLRPLVQERDEVALSSTRLASKIRTTQNEFTKVESQHINLARKNVALSTEMLALADEANVRKKEDITDRAARQQLEELEAEMKTSRQRWRIMKGTASATIAGSGVDWARDPQLLEVVLDEGDLEAD